DRCSSIRPTRPSPTSPRHGGSPTSWPCSSRYSSMRCGRRAEANSTRPRKFRFARTEMADTNKHDIDEFTGTAMTRHSWDGIRELDTPLPRWWLWVFYATIVWAIGYWVLYPAWPLVTSYTKGVVGWGSRAAVATDLADLRAQRASMMDRLAAAKLDQIMADPQ